MTIDRLEERVVLSGVVTIGDSWAWLIAANAPGSAPPISGFNDSLGTVLNTFHPGTTHYNESFGGGTSGQHVADLHTPSGIVARINAHPDADIVWLSSGGNDMLLGQLGGGFVVNSPNNPTLYATIQANVQTLVDSILAIRPDIQVVVEGYDYLNIWDTVSGATGDTIRLNMGVIKSGNKAVDAVQNLAVNDGFKAAEAGKIAVADASRRVAHINNFGLNNTAGGYNGYFGSFPAGTAFPPELYPHLPTPANRMNTTDPIHLNNLGYGTLALYAELQYFSSALAPAQLSVSTDSLDFGSVRYGTSAVLGVTASNSGPNYTKVKNLSFSAGTGDFSGGGLSFDPLFKDPSLGSDSAAVNYVYTPSDRGADMSSVDAASDSGSPTVSLAGQGVGPVFSSAGSIDVPTFMADTPPQSAEFSVSNATSDGDLGALTDLTLNSAAITGPDAARFSLAGFTPGMILEAGGSVNLSLNFDQVGAEPGTYTALLSFHTDQGAALGGMGEQIDIPISVNVLIPGDATADGLVDGADYTLWADHYLQETTEGYHVGDFNADGLIDGGDYTLWADHYAPDAISPAASAAATSVPPGQNSASTDDATVRERTSDSKGAIADRIFAEAARSQSVRLRTLSSAAVAATWHAQSASVLESIATPKRPRIRHGV